MGIKYKTEFYKMKQSWPEILLIYCIVLMGAIRDEFSFLSFAPHELLIIVLFVRIFLSKTRISFTKVDLSFTVFYLGIYIIPMLVNIAEFKSSIHNISSNFLVIKIWLFYKVIEHYLCSSGKRAFLIKLNILSEAFLNAALISAILGLLFFFNILPMEVLYKSKELYSSRLATTVGGINTTGVFFSLMVCLELFKTLWYKQKLNRKHMVRLVFFLSNILLSGSMTGMGVLVVSILAYLNYAADSKIVIRSIFVFSVVIFVFLALPWADRAQELVSGRINKRIVENKYADETILPSNLYGRYLEWDVLTRKILKTKPIFGYGFKSKEYYGAKETNFRDVRIVIPESYYMNILIYGALFGLLCYIIHVLLLGNLVSKIGYKKQKAMRGFLFTIMVAYMLAQVTQTTLQYSGLTEFYGFYLAIIGSIVILNKKSKIIRNNGR